MKRSEIRVVADTPQSRTFFARMQAVHEKHVAIVKAEYKAKTTKSVFVDRHA